MINGCLGFSCCAYQLVPEKGKRELANYIEMTLLAKASPLTSENPEQCQSLLYTLELSDESHSPSLECLGSECEVEPFDSPNE